MISPDQTMPWFHEPACEPPEDDMEFEGRYGDVLAQMSSSVETGAKPDFWLPGRVVRGVLDYKIEKPNRVVFSFDVVRLSAELAIRAYGGTLTPDVMRNFTNRRAGMIGDLSEYVIEQERDNISAESSSSALTRETTEALYTELGGADILLIPLGHGGTIPGILAHLNYNEIVGSDTASILYPVRFSRDKKEDEVPQLSDDEFVGLTELADGRKVVVFDEDCCSGGTLQSAVTFFEDMLSTEAVPVANTHSVGFKNQPILLGKAALKKQRR